MVRFTPQLIDFFLSFQVERSDSSMNKKKAADLDDFESVMKRVMEDRSDAFLGSDGEDTDDDSDEWSDQKLLFEKALFWGGMFYFSMIYYCIVTV